MSQLMRNILQKTFAGAGHILCLSLALCLFPFGFAQAGFEYVPSTNAMEGNAVASAAAAYNVSGTGASDVVQGGADNVPLSVAMRQILPQDVGFAPGEGVDMSMPVSWKGGRPWRVVMSDVLASAGLTAVQSGNVFLIHSTAPKVVQTPTSSVAMASPVPVGANDSLPAGDPVPAIKFAKIEPGVDDATPVTVGANLMSVQDGMGGNSSAGAMETWSGQRGATLRAVLQEWSRRAGVDLYWSTPFDYPVMTTVNVQGNFEQATGTLLKGFEKAAPQPFGRLYKNPNMGNAVLVIETRGNNYGE